MKICPNGTKIAKVRLKFGQILNKLSKNYQRVLKMAKMAKFWPSLVINYPLDIFVKGDKQTDRSTQRILTL